MTSGGAREEEDDGTLVTLVVVVVVANRLWPMSSNSSSALVIAGIAAVILVAVAAVAFFATPAPAAAADKAKKTAASSSQEQQQDKKDDARAEKDSEEAIVLPKSTLIEVFVQITNQMEKVILKISQLEQQLVNQAAQEGQQVDYEQFRQLMMNEFKNSMKEAEARVYAHYKVTEAQVEASAQFFADDADFQQALKTLKRKFALFTGQGGEDVPEHVTMELVMNVMSETMTRMTAAMEEVFNQTKEAHPVGTDAFNQTLQTRYVDRVGVIRGKVQKKYNLDQDLLQAGVIKYQSDPVFQAKMLELTSQQRETFARLGL